MMLTPDIVLAIKDEMGRAEAKYPGKGVGSGVWSDAERYVILGEEVGEVADEISLTDFDGSRTDNLRAELVQVAAVCCAWIQRIDLDASRALDGPQ